MEKIKEMSIDLETYSDVDIKKSGVYKYAESENFEILLFAVSINGDDVIVYDLNKPFDEIAKQLDEIAAAHFDGIEKTIQRKNNDK